MTSTTIERPVPRILIAEDDERFAETLALEFSERDYEVFRVRALADLTNLHADGMEFAIVDLRLKNDSGLDLLDLLKKRFPNCRAVVLTGYGSIPTAVEAMKRGAIHYLTKPVRIDDIENALWDEPVTSQDLDAPPTTLAQVERDFIDSILLQCGGNITQAAKRLGLHRQSLQRKLKKLS
jgi:two-component system response regulator RegA